MKQKWGREAPSVARLYREYRRIAARAGEIYGVQTDNTFFAEPFAEIMEEIAKEEFNEELRLGVIRPSARGQ